MANRLLAALGEDSGSGKSNGRATSNRLLSALGEKEPIQESEASPSFDATIDTANTKRFRAQDNGLKGPLSFVTGLPAPEKSAGMANAALAGTGDKARLEIRRKKVEGIDAGAHAEPIETQDALTVGTAEQPIQVVGDTNATGAIGNALSTLLDPKGNTLSAIALDYTKASPEKRAEMDKAVSEVDAALGNLSAPDKLTAQDALNAAGYLVPPVEMSGVAGYPEIIGGGIDLAKSKSLPDAAAAGNRIIGGGMRAATPLIVSSMAKAPVEVATNLVGADVASRGVEGALEDAGVRPEYAGLAGTVAAIAPFAKAAGVGGKLEAERTAKADYAAAVDDLVRAQVDAANANGVIVKPAEIAAAKKAIIESKKPLQDIVDSANALREQAKQAPVESPQGTEKLPSTTAAAVEQSVANAEAQTEKGRAILAGDRPVPEAPTPNHEAQPIGIDSETGLPIYKRKPEGVVERGAAEPALDAEMRGADPRLSLSVEATKEAAEQGNPNYVARTTEAERVADAKNDITAQTDQKLRFLEHLSPETRSALAADSPEIQQLLAQHFPEEIASKEVGNVAREDAVANREVQDVQPSAAGPDVEGAQRVGGEGNAQPSSEPPVRTPSEAAEVTDDQVGRGINKLFEHGFRNEAVKNTVQRLVDEEANPRPIIDRFWNETFPRLSDKGRQMFTKQVEGQIGLKPGDVISVDKSGNKIVAKDWREIIEGGLHDSVESMEHGDQAIVGLADLLNERAGDTHARPKLGESKPEIISPEKPAPKGFKKNRERGAVDPELLVSPFNGAAKLTKAVGEAAAEGRGVAAAVGNEKRGEAPPPSNGGLKFAQPPSGDLPKYAGSINLERTPAEIRKQVLDRYTANKPEIDANYRKNVISNDETKALARDLRLDKAEADKLLNKGATSGRSLSRVEMLKLRDYYASVEREAREVGQRYQETGKLADLIEYQEKLAEASAVHPSVQRNAAEFGRQLQSLKILAEARNISKTNAVRATELLRKEFGDAWEQNSREVIERISRIPEGDVREFNKVLRQYAKFSFGDKLNSFYVANLLSGIQTNVKNFVGNASMPPIETTVKVLRASLDPALAKLQGRPREYFMGEAAASVAGRVQGFKQGLLAAKQILRDGMTEQQAAKLEMPRHYEFQGLAKAWNIPGRLLSASDAIFKATAISGELRAQAVKLAMKEGARGQSLDARVKQLIQSPTDEMVNAAYEQAKFETFTSDPGAFTKAFLRFREDAPPLKPVAPFVNVPINLLKRGSELMPAGFLEPVRDMAMGRLWEAMGRPDFAKGKMSLKDPRVADAFARATIGTAIAIYAAQKYADGELTGRAPASAGDRDAFLRTRQEYSVKVGNRWVRYTDFGPLAIPFLSGAAIEDARQTNKNFPAEAVATEAIGSLARGIFEQSFFTGIGNLFDVMGPGRGGSFGDAVERTASGYASGLVPFSGLQRSVKNAMDPVFRQPDNIYERIKSGLPWLSETVPSKLNALGEEQKGSRLNGIFGFGLRDTKVPNADIEKELARLEVSPSIPSKALNIASRQFELTRDQQRELTGLLGEARKQVLRQLFANQLEVTIGKGDTRTSGTYGEFNDEQKRAAIDNALEDAYEAARDEFVTRVNSRKEAVKEKPKKAKLQFVGAAE
jgi:hypothetical protein